MWPDTRGYYLSDRVWNSSEATAKQIDMLLEQALAKGTSAVDLAKQLQGFLLPSQRGIMTNTPYGNAGSYAARRLARTEITRAHSMATMAAGVANPFVTKARYNLSKDHVADAGDPCEAFADESDAKGGYDPADVPIPGGDSHPHCMCYITHDVISQEDAIAMIRDGITSDREAAFTDTGSIDLFTMALWGGAVWDVFNRLFP